MGSQNTGQILGAIGQGFNTFAQRRVARRDQASFVQMAQQRFNEIGSEEAQQFAMQMAQNPRAAMAYADQFGGFRSLYEGMRERGAAASMADALENAGAMGSAADTAAGEAGGTLTAQGIQQFMVNALRSGASPGEAYSMAQVLTFGLKTQTGPPEWWLNAAGKASPSTDSLKAAIEHGQSTQDWDGAFQLLQAKPDEESTKPPKASEIRGQRMNALLDKWRRRTINDQELAELQMLMNAKSGPYDPGGRVVPDPREFDEPSSTGGGLVAPSPSYTPPPGAVGPARSTPEQEDGWFDGIINRLTGDLR